MLVVGNNHEWRYPKKILEIIESNGENILNHNAFENEFSGDFENQFDDVVGNDNDDALHKERENALHNEG